MDMFTLFNVNMYGVPQFNAMCGASVCPPKYLFGGQSWRTAAHPHLFLALLCIARAVLHI